MEEGGERLGSHRRRQVILQKALPRSKENSHYSKDEALSPHRRDERTNSLSQNLVGQIYHPPQLDVRVDRTGARNEYNKSNPPMEGKSVLDVVSMLRGTS